MKVLIVEDSSLLLERIDAILSEIKCISEISKTSNGLDVVKLHIEKNHDVIILDINLPDASGISILKEIKSFSKAKVIMLTNYSDPQYREICANLGADHFLDKSTEFEKIPTILKDFCI